MGSTKINQAGRAGLTSSYYHLSTPWGICVIRVRGHLAPKRISISNLLSNLLSKVIIAGKDDLRQDAVMQQVFGLLNSLLKRREGGSRGSTRDLQGPHLIQLMLYCQPEWQISLNCHPEHWSESYKL